MTRIELGYLNESLTREIYLCDIALAGIEYERVSNSEIMISERDLTILVLFHTNPDITIKIVA